MARSYLVRGMLAGLLAGLCAIAFAKVLAEPQIAKAEQFERQLYVQEGKPPEPQIVSRDVQDTVGLGTGVAVAGVALGGLFALVFAAVYRRLIFARAKTTAALVAGGAFLAVFVVPFLKYPANPPSVGNPDTIGRRTAAYFVLIAIGLLAMAVAVAVQRLASHRFGTWNANLLAAGAFVGIIVVSYVVLPGFNEVPAGFPPTVLWKFRLASIGTQLTLWGALGLIFGDLTERRESVTTRTASTF